MVDHPVRVVSASLKGKFTNGLDAVTLDELKLDLGGPHLMASGKANALNSAPHIDGAARIDEMPVDTVKSLWPTSIAPNPRAWLIANLSGGTIHHADIKIAASVPSGGGDVKLESMSGTMKGDGIAIHYLGALPSARNVSATGVFDQDALARSRSSAAPRPESKPKAARSNSAALPSVNRSPRSISMPRPRCATRCA